MTSDLDEETDQRERLTREAQSWVLRLASGHATRADLAALEHWRARSPLHAEALARASGRWRQLGPAIEQFAREANESRAGLGQRVGRRAFLGGALAASAAGAAVLTAGAAPLGLWPSISELTADYRTATGERRRIAVADSLSVEMNTQTSLNIRPATTNGDRIELIAGEAAIATRARAMEVAAARGRILAEEAHFDVRLDGALVCVTCLSGVVRVERPDGAASLGPAQQIAYGDRSLGEARAVDPALVAGWMQGDLHFHDEPLSRVIDEVNRYRRGKIILVNTALGARRFTARLKLDRLDVILAQLQGAFGARVTNLLGNIVLVT